MAKERSSVFSTGEPTMGIRICAGISGAMWRSVRGNGIDDDHNGYVDDYYGYDFAKMRARSARHQLQDDSTAHSLPE